MLFRSEWAAPSVSLPTRRCAACGVEFVPRFERPKTRFCSRDCKDIAKREREQLLRLLGKPDRSCFHCGKSMSRSMRVDAAFCSEACNSAAHQATRVLAKRTGEARPKRLLSRAKIAERCNWMCGLCGKRVDPTKRHPDPGYGSIDHIVPLAAGGSNKVSNLQLAHLRCNLKKRQFTLRSTGDQLPLYEDNPI